MCFRRENDGAAEPRKPRPRGSDPGTPWAAASGDIFYQMSRDGGYDALQALTPQYSV